MFRQLRLPRKQRYWIDFLLAITEKEIKARYKNAFLGFLWVILNPIIQMITIGSIFSFFVKNDVENYYLFLFSGLLPWNYFSYSLSKNTTMIVNERHLIKKAKFPRESIIFSIILSNLFHFLISLVLFLLYLSFWEVINFSGFESIFNFLLIKTVLVPIIIWLTILTAGISLLLSALNVRFRDVSFIVQAILPIWFYGTPVIYTLDLLPENLRPLFYLNPMTSIIEGFQFSLLGKEIYSIDLSLISFIISLLIFYLGLNVFIKESKFFDDWL